MNPLLVVTGTGTAIGKTHVSCAVLGAAKRAGRVAVGYKPLESGVTSPARSDFAALRRASSFHVQPPVPYVGLRAGLSPHLAARRERARVSLARVVDFVGKLREQVPVLVELPGGLFSPTYARQRCVDWITALAPTCTLLVAPDRLGVLHDVGATTTAAAALGCPLDAVVLVTPATRDASTSQNAPELRRFVPVPVVGCVPRAPVARLAAHPVVARVLRLWLP